MKITRSLTLSTALLLGTWGVSHATVLYATGFEAPTYAVGQLGGQAGWVAGGPAAVQNTVAADGNQALVVRTAGVTGQTFNALPVSYSSVGNAEQRVRFSVDFMLDGLSATFAALDTLAAFGNGGFISQQLLVSNGQLCGFNPCSGPLLAVDTWYQLAMEFDFATQTATNYLNGVLFSSGAMAGGSTTLTAFALGINNSNPASNLTAYFDNLRIESLGNAVPEPASLALVGVALLGVGAATRQGRSRRK